MIPQLDYSTFRGQLGDQRGVAHGSIRQPASIAAGAVV
jgi:hypothetical protein